MSNIKPLKWDDVAGHPVVVCPNCGGKSESGSPNYNSLKLRGICATCFKKEKASKNNAVEISDKKQAEMFVMLNVAITALKNLTNEKVSDEEIRKLFLEAGQKYIQLQMSVVRATHNDVYFMTKAVARLYSIVIDADSNSDSDADFSEGLFHIVSQTRS